MSIWAEVRGSVSFHESTHFSFVKFVGEFFDQQSTLDVTKVNARTFLRYPQEFETAFNFSICSDGGDASAVVEKLVNNLPKGVEVDLEATIRFVK